MHVPSLTRRRRRWPVLVLAVLLAALPFLPGPVTGGAAAGFADTTGHWAEPAIRQLQARGTLAGFPDGTFRPDQPLRRVEAAVALSRALELRAGGKALPYADAGRIPAWAAPHVAAVAPLMRGVPGPGGQLYFQADRLLTRAELAVVLDRAHVLLTGEVLPRPAAGLPAFTDAAAIPEWAREAVAALHAAGILTGRPGGRFGPAEPTTRAELAVVLARLPGSGHGGDGGAGGGSGATDPEEGDASGPYVLGYYGRSGATDQRALQSLKQGAGIVTAVAEFGFAVDAQGNITGRPDPALHAYARAQGIPVLAVIHNDPGHGFDRNLVHRVLTTPAVRARALASIVDFAAVNGYAGVNLDFENVPAADRAQLTAFARELAQALRARGLMFTMAVAAKESDDPTHFWSGAYDYAALGRIADYIILMAYDQHWAGSAPGPVAGLPWVTSVTTYAVSQIPAERLLLGTPAYGYTWPAGGVGRAFASRQALALAARHGATVQWHDEAQVPFFRYRSGGVNYTAYFENAHSLRPKVRLARSLGLAGIALWRLGYEESGVWPLLARYRSGAALTLDW